MIISDLAYLEDISEGTNPTGSQGVGYIVSSANPTLSGITSFAYGDSTASCYEPVAELNGLSDPNQIYVGQKLYLPEYVPGCGSLII